MGFPQCSGGTCPMTLLCGFEDALRGLAHELAGQRGLIRVRGRTRRLASIFLDLGLLASISWLGSQVSSAYWRKACFSSPESPVRPIPIRISARCQVFSARRLVE